MVTYGFRNSCSENSYRYEIGNVQSKILQTVAHVKQLNLKLRITWATIHVLYNTSNAMMSENLAYKAQEWPHNFYLK